MQRWTWLWPLIVNMHPAESKRSSRLDAQQILLSFALSSSICIGGAKREQGKRRHCGGRGEGMSPSPGCRRAPRGSRAPLHALVPACFSIVTRFDRSHTYIWVHRCKNRREGPHPCFRASGSGTQMLMSAMISVFLAAAAASLVSMCAKCLWSLECSYLSLSLSFVDGCSN